MAFVLCVWISFALESHQLSEGDRRGWQRLGRGREREISLRDKKDMSLYSFRICLCQIHSFWGFISKQRVSSKETNWIFFNLDEKNQKMELSSSSHCKRKWEKRYGWSETASQKNWNFCWWEAFVLKEVLSPLLETSLMEEICFRIVWTRFRDSIRRLKEMERGGVRLWEGDNFSWSSSSSSSTSPKENIPIAHNILESTPALTAGEGEEVGMEEEEEGEGDEEWVCILYHDEKIDDVPKFWRPFNEKYWEERYTIAAEVSINKETISGVISKNPVVNSSYRLLKCLKNE